MRPTHTQHTQTHTHAHTHTHNTHTHTHTHAHTHTHIKGVPLRTFSLDQQFTHKSELPHTGVMESTHCSHSLPPSTSPDTCGMDRKGVPLVCECEHCVCVSLDLLKLKNSQSKSVCVYPLECVCVCAYCVCVCVCAKCEVGLLLCDVCVNTSVHTHCSHQHNVKCSRHTL